MLDCPCARGLVSGSCSSGLNSRHGGKPPSLPSDSASRPTPLLRRTVPLVAARRGLAPPKHTTCLAHTGTLASPSAVVKALERRQLERGTERVPYEFQRGGDEMLRITRMRRGHGRGGQALIAAPDSGVLTERRRIPCGALNQRRRPLHAPWLPSAPLLAGPSPCPLPRVRGEGLALAAIVSLLLLYALGHAVGDAAESGHASACTR